MSPQGTPEKPDILVSFVEKRVKLTTSPDGTYHGECQFCGSPEFLVIPCQERWTCPVCNRGGDFIDWLTEFPEDLDDPAHQSPKRDVTAEQSSTHDGPAKSQPRRNWSRVAGSGACNAERLHWALKLRRDYSLAPCGICPGTKRPWHRWKEFQHAPPNDQEIKSFFSELPRWYVDEWGEQVLLGILGGAGSGGLEVLDFDIPSKRALKERGIQGSPPAFEPWWEQVLDHGYEDLLNRLVVVSTPSGGRQVYYRCIESQGNMKLARRAATPEELQSEPNTKVQVLIETRGNNGLVLCFPTPGYTFIRGGFESIPDITPEERRLLIGLAQHLDEMPIEQHDYRQTTSRKQNPGDVSPGDDFNARASWEEAFGNSGWRHTGKRLGDRFEMVRPGKNPREGGSGTIGPGRHGKEVFICFTTSTEFESTHPGTDLLRGYDKFAVYTQIHHGGLRRECFSAAAKVLCAQGYGNRKTFRGARCSRSPDRTSSSSVAPTGEPRPQPEPDGAEGDIPEGDQDQASVGPYFEQGGWLYKRTFDNKGEEASPRVLANFTCRIIEELRRDDGEETQIVYRICADVSGATQTVDVPARDFPSMSWVGEMLGANAVLSVGVKDHVRAAVLILSHPVRVRTVYTHTGWRQIDSVWVYLTGAGGIGPSGPVENVTCELDDNLEGYSTEPPRQPAPPLLRRALALLDLGPPRVMAALVGAAALAPLISLFTRNEPDFTVWIYGETGTFKTAVAAVIQALWGSFRRLPGSFTSTPNAIEKQCYATKDAVFVLDDYFPPAGKKQQQQLLEIVDKVVRSGGNRKGRDRMAADLSLRRGFPPRCLTIVTAEGQIEGASSLARIVPVEIRSGDIDISRLTEAQSAIDEFQGAMYHFLRWVAANHDRISEKLPELMTAFRSRLCGVGEHLRQPTQVALLLCGLEVLLLCCMELGAISQDESQATMESALAGLIEAAAAHGDELRDQDPVRQFTTCLREGLASGRAYLTTKTGGAPEEHSRWGWHMASHGGVVEPATSPGAAHVGYLDGDFIFLLPESAFAIFTLDLRKRDRINPVNQSTLGKQMLAHDLLEGQLEQRGGKEVRRHTTMVRIANGSQRLWKVRVAKFEEMI